MEANNHTYERKIDLVQLFLALWRKVGIIILVGVIFAVLFGVYNIITFAPQSMYSAIARVYVERDFSKINMDEMLKNSDNLILNEGVMTSQYYKELLTNSLKEDYKVIITSNTVLEEVKNKLGLDINYNELYSRITTNSLGSSIVEIKVKNEDEQLAKDIVNALAEVSSKRIMEVMDVEKVEIVDQGFAAEDLTPEQLTQLAEGQSIDSVLPAQSLSIVSVLKNVIIGGILGCILAVAVVLCLYIIDKTIKDEKDIEYYLGLPVIGSVPIIKGTKKQVVYGQKKRAKRLSQYSK